MTLRKVETDNGTFFLRDGEEICRECKGRGLVIKTYMCEFNNEPIEDEFQCPTCRGAGKLDWVEKVVGKRKKDPDEIWRYYV